MYDLDCDVDEKVSKNIIHEKITNLTIMMVFGDKGVTFYEVLNAKGSGEC